MSNPETAAPRSWDDGDAGPDLAGPASLDVEYVAWWRQRVVQTQTRVRFVPPAPRALWAFLMAQVFVVAQALA